MATPFDKKAKAEKAKRIHEIYGGLLLEEFLSRHSSFNPTDLEACETYELLKAELIKRLDLYHDIVNTVKRMEAK